MYDFAYDDPNVADGKRQLREFAIEDLLFREPIKFTSESTTRYYRGKTVLVTGGGGSIGSELCRQIARRNPKKLIILDIYENNAYDIQQELRAQYGKKQKQARDLGKLLPDRHFANSAAADEKDEFHGGVLLSDWICVYYSGKGE